MIQRPLLILDIDETLIHGSESELGRRADFRAGAYHIYLRPHVEEFLDTARSAYNLACWSSATDGYLKIIMSVLMPEPGLQPLFVWDRKRCTRLFDSESERFYFLKNLKKVKRYGYDLKQVLILEDEPIKVNRHFGNAVYVRPYRGAAEDDELLKLGKYLLSIADEPDFRQMEKRFWRHSNATL